MFATLGSTDCVTRCYWMRWLMVKYPRSLCLQGQTLVWAMCVAVRTCHTHTHWEAACVYDSSWQRPVSGPLRWQLWNPHGVISVVQSSLAGSFFFVLCRRITWNWMKMCCQGNATSSIYVPPFGRFRGKQTWCWLFMKSLQTSGWQMNRQLVINQYFIWNSNKCYS